MRPARSSFLVLSLMKLFCPKMQPTESWQCSTISCVNNGCVPWAVIKLHHAIERITRGEPPGLLQQKEMKQGPPPCMVQLLEAAWVPHQQSQAQLKRKEQTRNHKVETEPSPFWRSALFSQMYEVGIKYAFSDSHYSHQELWNPIWFCERRW